MESAFCPNNWTSYQAQWCRQDIAQNSIHATKTSNDAKANRKSLGCHVAATFPQLFCYKSKPENHLTKKWKHYVNEDDYDSFSW